MAEFDLTPVQLAEELELRLKLMPQRAVVAFVEVAPSRKEEVLAAVRGVLGTRIEGRGSEWHWIDGTEADRTLLAHLNRERDLRLDYLTALVLLVPDAEAGRLAREIAPDLLAAPDLVGRVSAERRGRPEVLAEALRAFAIERHGTIDMTGLLPGSTARNLVPVEQLYLPLVDIERRPEEPRAFLMLADPGAGKTTWLRHLALEIARRADPLDLAVQDAVPVLAPLVELAEGWAKDRVRSPVEDLVAWLTREGIADADALPELLPRVVLLLDGIDEVRSPTVRRALVERTLELAERGEVAGLVLTGRSFLVDELRAVIPRMAGVVARAPERDQIEAYLTAFVRLRGRPDAENQGRLLSFSIEIDSDLRSLARNPLLLLFLALLHELEGRLPDRRIELYGRLGELLVDRWIRARSLSKLRTGRSAARGDVMAVLGPLAWWVVERGGGAVHGEEIERRLTELEERREDPEEAKRRASELLGLLREESALLRPEPGGRWAFVHPSVAEFFAAREAERDPATWAKLVADPFKPEWREIVLFAAGIVGVEKGATARLDELVDAILRGARRRGRYEARHPSLLIGLLREDPLLSTRQRRAIAERLCEFWFEAPFQGASAQLVQMEAVRFLRWAASSPAWGIVREALAAWFDPDPTRVRWDRLAEARPVSVWGIETGGWLVRALPDLLDRYYIDSAPTLNFLRHHPDPLFREVADQAPARLALTPPPE